MKATLVVLAFGLALSLSLERPAVADVLTLEASEAVVLPADESEMVRTALRFNLSALESVEKLDIDEAFLQWQLLNVPNDVSSEFFALAVTNEWLLQAAAEGATVLTTDSETARSWEITPADYELNQGLVRLDVTAVVRDWISGARANNGMVFSTDVLSGSSLREQLDAARLTVRYALVK